MEGLSAHYSVGDAVTFDEMVQQKKEEKEISLYNPFENLKEENPYVFEDTPIGLRKFAVVNIVGEYFQQKHDRKKCMIKVKVSTISHEKAKQLCEVIEKRDKKYALYVIEMFKFICLPPLTRDDVDSEMNTAIKMEYTAVNDEREGFNNRKQTMLDELKRHNEITKKIAEGELDASQAQSAPILPECMKKDETSTEEVSDCMEPDVPLCTDRYAVIATLKITKYEKMKDHIIMKLCGTFENEADANSHMKTLKKDTKYKLFDVTVCDMCVWLEMPPPYELIENVIFDSNKLTETVGQRKQTINIDSSDMQVAQDE